MSTGIELRGDATGWRVMLSEARPGEGEQGGLTGLYPPHGGTRSEMEQMHRHEEPPG